MTGVVRTALVERLEVDLIGPSSPDETIPDAPSDRYLSGVLFPLKTPVPLSEDDGQLGSESDGQEASEDDSAGLFLAMRPACAGLSFAAESDGQAPTVRMCVSCGTYVRLTDGKESKGSQQSWKRTARSTVRVVSLVGGTSSVPLSPEIPGMEIHLHIATTGSLTTTTATLVNRNEADADSRAEAEERSFFQVGLEVVPESGTRLMARPSRRSPTDEDGLVSALIYRDAKEFAVGHTCSAEWSLNPEGVVERVATTWVPTSVVRSMSAAGDEKYFDRLTKDPSLKPLSAAWLSDAADPDLVTALRLLVAAYSDWIDGQSKRVSTLETALQPQALKNVETCRRALARMESSIALINKSAKVRSAFRLAQKAIAIQRRWTKEGETDFKWRPFQLAFQLLSLESLADPNHADRGTMDLLWFPTGGGKTEAYLGLTAFILFLRRLQGTNPDDGAGVAVLMRYTLRLLTVQQFQRAAAVVLACEHLRRGALRPTGTSAIQLGVVPFSIGLWVGQGATPNNFKQAKTSLGTRDAASTPKQLLACPCCRGLLKWEADDVRELVIVTCKNKKCEFAAAGAQLPVWTMDANVYSERPSLVIATVDKFAQIARTMKTANLFGLQSPPGRPPDLIIQDELHLISGPLGTITGAYEVAIDQLCSRGLVRPKLIGSTATIRRAKEQIRALFDRETFQFPPPCLDSQNSGFAVEDKDAPGRLYVGLTTAGRSPKFALQATSASLLQSAASISATPKERDPYWTLVTYFNSLRELGGALVLMLDDVPASVSQFASRRGEPERALSEPVELTSRVSSSEIPEVLESLMIPSDKDGALDSLLASNMISVGVDIPRLGVMVVNGQPKTIAEYIQSTSRVGRESPGLVVSLYNHARARDRSHYETFANWHSTLYREVEATSVTPFAARARDKTLPAVLVAMARHLVASMADDFKLTPERRTALAPVIAELNRRAAAVSPDDADGFARKLTSLLNEWQGRKDLEAYWKDDHETAALLMSAEQYAAFGASGSRKRTWPAPNSMREVEPGTEYRLREALGVLRNDGSDNGA